MNKGKTILAILKSFERPAAKSRILLSATTEYSRTMTMSNLQNLPRFRKKI